MSVICVRPSKGRRMIHKKEGTLVLSFLCLAGQAGFYCFVSNKSPFQQKLSY